MNGFGNGLLSNLAKVRDARTLRASSWDRSGRNQDNWQILPGATVVLAEIDGPGAITHIWMTQSMRITRMADLVVQDPDMYRKLVLKMYWDGEKNPSINVPLGDFFCLGHSIASNFCSLPFSSSTDLHGKFGGGAALNCYLPMPFAKHARVELVNEGEWPAGQYFYIDYEVYDRPLDTDIAYLHAQWRRENPHRRLGPRDPREHAGGEHPQPRRQGQLRVPGRQGPRALHRLQPVGHQPPEHLVGRRRRHDLGRRLQVAAGPARHGHRGLLQPGVGHAEERVPVQRVESVRARRAAATRRATTST